MRLKALPLLCLSLLLATQTSFAQQKTKSSRTSASECGIDSASSYTGSEVAEMIQVVAEEAERAVDRAFDEGYKQGLLAAAPEAEYWRVKAEQREAEIAWLKKEKWLYAFGGLGAGFLVGGGIGFAVRIRN